MAHSGVTVEDACFEIFNELKMFKKGEKNKYRYILFKLNDKMEAVVVDQAAPRESTYDDMVNALPKDDCRWVVFDFEWEMVDPSSGNSVQKDKIGFISWAPESAKVRSKMVFSSTSEAVKKKLQYNGPAKHCSDSTDLNYSEILEHVKGHK